MIPFRPFSATASGVLTDPTGIVNPTIYSGWLASETAGSTAGFKLLDGAVAAPGAATAALVTIAGLVEAGTHSYKVTFVTGDGETEAGTASNVVTTDVTHAKITVSAIPVSTSSRVTSRKIYRTEAGGSTYKLHSTIADNITTTFLDNTADGSLTTSAPSANTSGFEVARYTFAANGTANGTTGSPAGVAQAGTGSYLRMEVTSGAVRVTVFGR